MKVKLIIAAILVIALYGTVIACSSDTEAARTVSCEDFSQQNHMTQELNVAAGEIFTVALCSNPTTGFRWDDAAVITDTAVVAQTKHEYVAPEGENAVPGAAGQEIWTFNAQEKGTTTVTFEYSRPWEGGEKGEWTYTLTVTVQ